MIFTFKIEEGNALSLRRGEDLLSKIKIIFVLTLTQLISYPALSERDETVRSHNSSPHRASPFRYSPTDKESYCAKNKNAQSCKITNNQTLMPNEAADLISSCPQSCESLNVVDRETWGASPTIETCTRHTDKATFMTIDTIKLDRGKAQCQKNEARYNHYNSRLQRIKEPNCIPPMTSPDSIVVHHTTDEGFGSVKDITPNAIQKAHMNGQGWSDIGYHFLIAMDANGEWQVYEGRKRLQGKCQFNQGGHSGPGLNRNSLGIAIAGNYEKESKPSWAAIDGTPKYPAGALKKLVQLTAKLKEDCPSINKIRGHGDHQQAGYGCVKTQCPGSSCQGIIDRLEGIL